MTNNKLKDYNILNTRPKTQATELTHALQQHGANVVELPALVINLTPNPKDLQDICANINTFDKIIFVSANAANAVAQYWQPFNGEVFCIGPATNKLVQTFHQPAIVPNDYSISGLLKLPQMLKLTDQSIIIICGSNHNNELKQELISRGANVNLTISYQVSNHSNISPAQLDSIIKTMINIIICTSTIGLQQIYTLFSTTHLDWLITTPIVVISEKMLNQAINLGWQRDKILRSNNPTTQSILDTLLQTA